MSSEIAGLIRPWASVWTWHTSHPLDKNRFYKVIDAVFNAMGGDILHNQFQEALISVIADTPETLDGPQSEETIDRFVSEAIGILGYLENKQTRL